MAERALLEALGGNCHSAIGVHTRAEGGQLVMRAALYSPDGATRIDGEARFAAGDTQGPAALAHDLLDRSPPVIRALFTGG
jgi:hydroxymethylbilane synthase